MTDRVLGLWLGLRLGLYKGLGLGLVLGLYNYRVRVVYSTLTRQYSPLHRHRDVYCTLCYTCPSPIMTKGYVRVRIGLGLGLGLYIGLGLGLVLGL